RCYLLAIFHEVHSSSPLRWKIACSCLDSTNNAVVSASALSLRRRSRSSSRIRLRLSRVSWGLARSSGFSVRAAMAFCFHCSSSLGYTPFSRHQVLRWVSSMAAVAITACSRAAAVHTRSRAGVDSASARHRSSVATDTPSSCETVYRRALRGKKTRYRALFECFSVPCHFVASCPIVYVLSERQLLRLP